MGARGTSVLATAIGLASQLAAVRGSAGAACAAWPGPGLASFEGPGCAAPVGAAADAAAGAAGDEQVALQVRHAQRGAEGTAGLSSGGLGSAGVKAARSPAPQAPKAEGADYDVEPQPPSGWPWPWRRQKVTGLFYRPHFRCGTGTTPENKYGVRHALGWLEAILGDSVNGVPAPDFLGLSEMEGGTIGGSNSQNGYKNYKVIGATCGKWKDPIALYYDTAAWKLQQSYPPGKQCEQFPMWPDTQAWMKCLPNQTTPGEKDCCSCTYSNDEVAGNVNWNTTLYKIQPLNTVSDRPFVIGKFKRRKCGTKVCVVVGSMPHPIPVWGQGNLTRKHGCTSFPDSNCLGNSDFTSHIWTTSHFVQTVKRVCGRSRLLFMADTNVIGGTYPTGKLFETSGSTLALLNDPRSVVNAGASPYTCCQDSTDPSTMGVNAYASDRVAAYGFSPVSLRGGAPRAFAAVPPDTLGVKTCPKVLEVFSGYPCCGSSAEHAPVLGTFRF